MAEIGTQFLSGLQTAQSQTLGNLQTIEGARSLVAQRDKTKRIQGLIGQYGEATRGEKRGIEEQLFLDDPTRAQGLRQFRTKGEATMAQNLARDAVITENALGTEEEPQAMLWFSKQAADSGLYTPEQVQGVMSQYSALVATNPEGATELAAQTLDRFVTRGTSADDMLGERRDLRAEIAKEQRALTTTLAEEERGEKKGIRLEGIKQKGRLELATIKQKGKAIPAREQKIQDTMGAHPDLTRSQAIDLVDGNVRLGTDPLTKATTIVNLATGEETPTGTPTVDDIDRAANVPEKTLMQSIDDAYGALPFLQEGISKTFGQIFGGANYPEVTAARTHAKVMEKNLLNALALSGRPPVFEQERILNLLPELGLLESPDRARTIHTTLFNAFSRQIMDDKAVENDRNIAVKTRTEAQSRRIAIESVLRELGPPIEQEQLSTVTTQEEFDALESGAKYLTSDGRPARKP